MRVLERLLVLAVLAGLAAAVVARLESVIAQEEPIPVLAVPVGTVVAYAGKATEIPDPEHWCLCDGRPLRRDLYRALFRRIGIAHGWGDGSSTFNIPDYQGRFLRGVDHGEGRDPDAGGRQAMGHHGNTGDNVGSVQRDMIQSHKHDDSGHQHWIPIDKKVTDAPDGDRHGFHGDGGHHTDRGKANLGDPTDSGTGAGPARHGKETRPKNAYVNWIIRIR